MLFLFFVVLLTIGLIIILREREGRNGNEKIA
jgi:hypothetical protein